MGKGSEGVIISLSSSGAPDGSSCVVARGSAGTKGQGLHGNSSVRELEPPWVSPAICEQQQAELSPAVPAVAPGAIGMQQILLCAPQNSLILQRE